jgi:hypothetical protein
MVETLRCREVIKSGAERNTKVDKFLKGNKEQDFTTKELMKLVV